MQATIEVSGLRKRFGHTLALDGMSFTVQPGQVTGFVGPNGAGKSTTMRVILGLDAAEEGHALVGGRPYPSLRTPLRHIGALLDAAALQPGRSARNHLLWLAHSQGLGVRRVDEVLEQVELTSAARRKAGGFSLGMRQRLGIAAALLGDPPVLMLDEPVNGLDPEGIVWIRGFLRSLAAEGRAVLVSSHLMSELQDAADHLVVVGRGRVITDTSVADLLNANAVPFSEVSAYRATLEEAYLELTRDAVEFGLTRSGDTLTGYESTDGTNWAEVGTARLSGLPATVEIGLFATSPGDLTVTQEISAGPLTGLIVVIVVAVMFVTAEYRRGLIRTTLIAIPRRGRMLVAKALTIGTVTFVAGLAATAITLTFGTQILRANGNYILPVSWLTEVRVVVGTAALLAVAAVLALALGALFRRSVGGVITAIVLIVVPHVLATTSVLPDTAARWLLRLTPAAGFAIQQSIPEYAHVLGHYAPIAGFYPLAPWAGFAVLAGYAALALGLAVVLLRRRDA